MAKQRLPIVVGLVAAVLVGGAALFLVYARVFGLDPGNPGPGMWMTGEVVTEPVTDWTFAHTLPLSTGVETRQWFMPLVAHSVNISRFHHGDRMYLGTGYPAGIKPPQGRLWNRNVLSNDNVRIRIAGRIYEQRLAEVTDPAEREAVLASKASGYGMDMYWAPGYYLHLWRVEPRR